MKRERLTIKQKIQKKIELRHENLVFINKKGERRTEAHQNKQHIIINKKIEESKPNEIKSEESQPDVQNKQLTLNFLNDKGEEIMNEHDMLRIYGRVLPVAKPVVKPVTDDAIKANQTYSLSRPIPKRIFFYWGGSDMSWMRYMTLYSFRKMNPDWEVILYVSNNISKIKSKGWESCENQDYFEYAGDNYFKKIKDLNIKIEKAEFPLEIQEKLKNMSPIHESDLFRYYQLYLNGGFYCDMDVLFFRPIDDFYNIIVDNGCDTIVHEYVSTMSITLTIGFLGASINNEFYKELFEFGINTYNNTKKDKMGGDYQSMGIQLIYKMFTNNPYASPLLNAFIKKYPSLNFYSIPTNLIYYFDFTKIKHCFSNSIEIRQFSHDAIGYHWYGGGVESQKYNNILTEKNYSVHKTTFSKIADEVINMKVDDRGYVIQEKIKKPKVSIIMTSYNRAALLNLGLSSIANQKTDYDLEIVVVNDGANDDTEKTCNLYKDKLNIKYIYSGYRNSNGMIYRSSPIPINIGIKRAEGDIIILSCAEIYHLNNGIDEIIKPLLSNNNYLTVPKSMYFDNSGEYTNDLLKNSLSNKLNVCESREDYVVMPFLMGVWKQHVLDIGGYDEDLIGYASEDNDFVDRLLLKKCEFCRVDAKIVHLYHGKRCSGIAELNNPDWVYNNKIYQERKGIMVRNVNKEWGNGMRISIVTAYCNRKKQFYETLKSIARSNLKNFEVIAVDDCSLPEERIEDFLKEFPFLKIIRLESKEKKYINSCIPYNIGIRVAIGEIIILQNPECLHVHDILTYVSKNTNNSNYITMSAYALDEKLTKELSKHNENNTVVDFFKSIIGNKWKHKTFGLSDVGNIGWYNHSYYCPVYYHFCSAITKKNMDLLGGFDERFAGGIAFEDDSFVEKVNKLKLKKIIVDEMPVIHQFHEKIYDKMPKFKQLYNKNKKLMNVLKKEKLSNIIKYT